MWAWQCQTRWGGHGKREENSKVCKTLREDEVSWLSTWRFIPKVNKVPRVLIHLPSLILHRCGHSELDMIVNYHYHYVQFQVCPAVEVLSYRRHISHLMCNVKLMTFNSYKEWLTHFTHILKATPPTHHLLICVAPHTHLVVPRVHLPVEERGW